MIWLTWRQFRAQTIVTAAFLAALAVTLLVTGLSLAHLYDSSGLATCHGPGSCGPLASSFINQVKGGLSEKVFYAGIYIVYAAPAIIGMFWGAPLIAREIEAGTFRLAWNQSVSRSRWVAVKLGLIGLAAMVTAELLALMTSWWASPVYQAAAAARSDSLSIARIAPPLFGAQGIAPIGYAAFAFTLGVTAGLLIRRTIPAMAVTLAGFALVPFAWPSWVRPHLISPLRESMPFSTARLDEVMIGAGNQMIVGDTASKPGAWILTNQAVKPDGQPFTGPPTQACLDRGVQACNAAIGRLHLRQVITYQPASRFWAFQWYETAIFLVLAVALAAFCAWWIRRRRLT
ncbi:MAG TPA: ABC transporter permease [Streptosporangiaceae bacterium]|nr:ABC transporter permease [Streptosporangiaceae bacterium]